MSDVVRVATKAMNMFLGDAGNLELVLLSFPGSSGARVSIFSHSGTKSLYAVKCSRNTRVSLIDEVSKRNSIESHFHGHLPQVLLCQVVDGYEVMISECDGVQTLHKIIMDSSWSHDQLLQIWSDVVRVLVSTWKRSRHEFSLALSPRYFPARLQRIHSGVQNIVVDNVALRDVWQNPMIINGQEYPSIASSFQEIADVGLPKYGVVCHGDPQPSNVVVTPSGDWYFVDWEWAGSQHDWKMMMSHLFGWWSTRCLVLNKKPQIIAKNTYCEINYDAHIPDHLLCYQDIAINAVDCMIDDSAHVEISQDINRYLSALYFGELRFLNIWGRDVFGVVMVAQAVITANQQAGVTNRFQFPNRRSD